MVAVAVRVTLDSSLRFQALTIHRWILIVALILLGGSIYVERHFEAFDLVHE